MRSIKIYALKYWALVTVRSLKIPAYWGERDELEDEIFRNASMHNHQINISGGNEGTTYSLSGGYLSQDGIGIGSSFERFSARVNMDNKITNWLSTGLRASVAKTQQNNTIDNGNIIRTAIQQLPEVPAKILTVHGECSQKTCMVLTLRIR
mgnify:CR=1 FL=1